MDPIKAKKPKLLRNGIEVLLPISIFSFILYHYTTRDGFTTSINLFISRKSMFLFCNSILLFLLKDYRLLSSSMFTNDDHLYHEDLIDDHRPSGSNSIEVKVDVVEEEVVSDLHGGFFMQQGGDLVEATSVVVEERGIVDSVGSSGANHELELLSREELNRRFEEFIEREKRKRRLESLQLLIVP